MASSKYILTERIAVGGMAEIHLGKIVGSDGFARICAFKKILPHFASDKEFIQMFRNEADVAKQLVNKNIVQVYDFVAEGDSYMLVMEYVDGQDLRSVLQLSEQARKRIPTELACYIIIELLSGLGYAHGLIDLSGRSLNIIHRDVSPQNILVSFEGDVKITDFGIAKVETHNTHTRAGVIKGKFSYMSPEQAEGRDIDARCDVFAAGIVLYEMLTMTRLFKGEELSVLTAVRECKIRPPSQVKDTSIPQELEHIVMRMLEKDVAKRYANAKEVVKDLSKFLYSFRPDFFAGELAEYMQNLFKEKIELSKARMRSTLALPFGTMGPGAIRYTKGEDALYGANAESPQQEKKYAEAPQTVVPQRAPQRGGRNAAAKMDPRRQQRAMRHNQRHGVRQAGGNPNAGFAQVLQKWSNASGINVPILVGLGAAVSLFLFFAVIVKLRAASSGGEVVISVSPALRVQVEVDGKKMFGGAYQQSPISLNLQSGERKIIVRRPGFNTKLLRVDLGVFGGPIKETVSLEKEGRLGQLRIVTSPPDAVVMIEDGLEGGLSPETFRNLPTGRSYNIKISHPRCSTLSAKEYLPGSAERSPTVKSYQLRNCK